MASQSTYQELCPSCGDGEVCEDLNHEETPLETGVIIHLVPESGKSRWNHIEDLDSFFARMYHYHQKHGFACMMLQEVLELGQIIFVAAFAIFLFHCVNYSKLFSVHSEKISIYDAIYPLEDCLRNMGFVTWICVIVASLFWFLHLIRVFYHFIQFWDIKSFFNMALKINDDDLDNMTWHAVQRKIIEVQNDLEMCIHKRELTELDIYHRILRFKNYIVAMINKSLLPLQLELPFLGNTVFFTRGLKYNLELLFFWGPWSPFENSWHLHEDYKKVNKRQDLAGALSKHILWIGIANLILCPLILLWQILYFFFNYGELLKREPGSLGVRTWSLYGKLYLRHFNELDHELSARLNRAYRPASKYMNMFASPLMSIIAQNIAFISGSIFAVCFALTFYDEDFLSVEHVLMIMTVSGGLATLCRSMIPDENLVWCPESLLTAVLAHTHYIPEGWRGQAHTQAIRAQVAQLFQYRAMHLIEELVSPLLTPYLLCFHLRYRALDIVDFYRNFTVELTGVGDVCSFAQMDVRKHGNPMWQAIINESHLEGDEISDMQRDDSERRKEMTTLMSNRYTQAEEGKTELSLVHFMLTNPEWKAPEHAEIFVNTLRKKVKKEALEFAHYDDNPLFASLSSLSSVSPEFSGVVASILQSTVKNQNQTSTKNTTAPDQAITPNRAQRTFDEKRYTNVDPVNVPKVFRRGMTKVEGSQFANDRSLLHDLQKITGVAGLSPTVSTLSNRCVLSPYESATPIELTAADMCLSALYLHELHHRHIGEKNQRGTMGRNTWEHSRHHSSMQHSQRHERTPLLPHADP